MIHFVGFRGDEYNRARRVFGEPDFIHMRWDRRAFREIGPDDLIVFAKGDAYQEPSQYNAPDLLEEVA